MAKPEGPFPLAGGGKNIVLFRKRKKFSGCYFPGPLGIHILNIASGSEKPGVLAGGEIRNGSHHSGVGDAEIHVTITEPGPSPGFGENFSISFTMGFHPFPRSPVQFPQNAPAFGPQRPATGVS
jgi:hypothetical protein